MALAQRTDHVDQALARRLEQYKGSALIESLVRHVVEQIQDAEDAIYGMLSQRSIAAASGAQLDVLGRILGAARATRTDADYRVLLTVRFRLNMGSGTAEDVLGIMAPLFPAGVTLRFRDEWPAAFTLAVYGPGVTETYGAYLNSARAAGVRALTEWNPVADAGIFTLEVPGDATPNGLGDATNPAVGGQMAGLI